MHTASAKGRTSTSSFLRRKWLSISIVMVACSAVAVGLYVTHIRALEQITKDIANTEKIRAELVELRVTAANNKAAKATAEAASSNVN